MIDQFFRAWLTFSMMIIGAAVLAAFWAARAGLFRNQERARNLALWAKVEEEVEFNGESQRRRGGENNPEEKYLGQSPQRTQGK